MIKECGIGLYVINPRMAHKKILSPTLPSYVNPVPTPKFGTHPSHLDSRTLDTVITLRKRKDY